LPRLDTLSIEGLAEPIALRLYRAPDGFPLRFAAYVPGDLEAREEESAIRFTAHLGGRTEPDAFLHVFVFPPGTDRRAAVASARGYKTGRGIAVGQGLEPIADDLKPPNLQWAVRAFRFRYQSGGRWFGGVLGVGEHDGRFYQIVRHRPVEYGDGFAPRADLVLETWRWADGSPLIPTATAR
jgi:hypothetical protein